MEEGRWKSTSMEEGRWKMLLHRMSDECLMKEETVFSFYTQYQAVMRKFTLAGKSVDVRWKM